MGTELAGRWTSTPLIEKYIALAHTLTGGTTYIEQLMPLILFLGFTPFRISAILWVVCEFKWKIIYKNKYLISNILQLTIKTFTVHVPNVISVEFVLCIKSRFTTNAQNILHLNQWTSVISLIMVCGTLSRMRGWLRMVWQHKNSVGEESLHFNRSLMHCGF